MPAKPDIENVMLSVVIPTLDSEEGLARTLAALVPAAAEGVVREVVVADGGSRDGTETVAEAAGCTFVRSGAQWSDRVGAGIAAVRRASWLLLLPPNVVLEGDWFRAVSTFVDRTERGGHGATLAATFRLEFDREGWRARAAEATVAVSSQVFGLPIAAQGLVFSRRLWDQARRGAPIADHRDFVGRIGRRSIRVLRAKALASIANPDEQRRSEGTSITRHALAALGLPVRGS